VLLPSPVSGLQVQGLDGVYREVTPEPGCFVINIGNMMECWSGGRFRSTMHRVHPPRHLERYSIGFFAVPNYDTVVEPLPGLPVTGKPEDMAPRHAGEDLKGFIDHFDRQVRDLEAA
jgi:isopenicillin N synthase-like dioxygenase